VAVQHLVAVRAAGSDGDQIRKASGMPLVLLPYEGTFVWQQMVRS
jgi:hypothetical protein